MKIYAKVSYWTGKVFNPLCAILTAVITSLGGVKNIGDVFKKPPLSANHQTNSDSHKNSMKRFI